jgi:hypothetical protein
MTEYDVYDETGKVVVGKVTHHPERRQEGQWDAKYKDKEYGLCRNQREAEFWIEIQYLRTVNNQLRKRIRELEE